MIQFKITGLDEIRERFKKAPAKYSNALEIATEQALLVVWENIPAYPAKPPQSTYTRRVLLGKSLGSSESGGKSSGQPDIYTNKMEGRYRVGEFGTSLNYAPYVIGERQAWMHRGRWWTLAWVLQKAVPRIEQAYQNMAETLAKWLDSGRN